MGCVYFMRFLRGRESSELSSALSTTSAYQKEDEKWGRGLKSRYGAKNKLLVDKIRKALKEWFY